MNVETRISLLETWPDSVLITPVAGWSDDYEMSMEVAPILDTSGCHSIFVAAVGEANPGAYAFHLWFLRALLARLGRPEIGDFELRSGPVGLLVTEMATADLTCSLVDEAILQIVENGVLGGAKLVVDCADFEPEEAAR